jgi:hypothetical protein
VSVVVEGFILLVVLCLVEKEKKLEMYKKGEVGIKSKQINIR